MDYTAFERQLLGLQTPALEPCGEHLLMPAVSAAFDRLAQAAAEAGFELRIASAYRSYTRQLCIWNEKMQGLRPVLDDNDCALDMETLDDCHRLDAVLRYSALPGTSRHHWGTDIDVYDRAAVDPDYRVQLSSCEVEEDGCFAALHDWLDARIAAGESYGFFRPYDSDRGGVARERWHLSFAPLAGELAAALDARLLRRVWRDPRHTPLFCLLDKVETRLDALLERFVRRIATAPREAVGYDGRA